MSLRTNFRRQALSTKRAMINGSQRSVNFNLKCSMNMVQQLMHRFSMIWLSILTKKMMRQLSILSPPNSRMYSLKLYGPSKPEEMVIKLLEQLLLPKEPHKMVTSHRNKFKNSSLRPKDWKTKLKN